jgi:uncharacterized alkaline shock family protein YloU
VRIVPLPLGLAGLILGGAALRAAAPVLVWHDEFDLPAGAAPDPAKWVHDLGGGTARTIGAIRDRIPGSSQAVGQGVAVEVGERQTAIDLDVVAEYGVSIVELSRAVRRNVISAVEGMTGLEVTEVNIAVNDIYLPSDDQKDVQEPRVQ